MTYPTPARIARMPWPVKQRLAADRRLSVREFERRALSAYKSRMAVAWWRVCRAEAAALDRQPDYHVKRCPVCGAWTLGECSTNHGWRT